MKLFLTVLICITCTALWAQKKADYDIILKTSGDELVGTVKVVADNDLKFCYKGEAVVYSIKKTEIIKVTFASGRIEFFNRPAANPSSSDPAAPAPAAPSPARAALPAQPATLEDHHNKVAILPFKFLIDRQSGGADMGEKAQQEAFATLSQHAAGLELQDVLTTNALLAKNGVNDQTIKQYTPIDLCNLLGVEYVVMATVSVNKGTATATTNNYGNTNIDRNRGKSGNDTKIFSFGSSSSYINQSYKTYVTLNVYNDKGSSLFSDSHEAFLTGEEAYRNAVKFLLKRSPIYRK